MCLLYPNDFSCCTVPPVVADGYKEKGEYMTIEGMKTYATGDKNAKSAILIIYDIFGFFPQTLQGADILATGDKEKQYQVFMPGSCLIYPIGVGNENTDVKR